MTVSDASYFNVRVNRQEIIPESPIFLDKCAFKACSVAVQSNDATHLRLSNVTLRDCTVGGGGIRGVILSNVLVDGLTVKSMPQIYGCLFEHVTLQGKINKLLIHAKLPTVYHPEPFYDAASKFNSGLDWGLDISQLDCPDLGIYGMPSRLIRRDPVAHAVVTKEEALAGRWRAVDFDNVTFQHTIEILAQNDWDDIILCARRSGKYAQRDQQVLTELRDLGVAY